MDLSFSRYCTQSCLTIMVDVGVAHKLLKKQKTNKKKITILIFTKPPQLKLFTSSPQGQTYQAMSLPNPRSLYFGLKPTNCKSIPSCNCPGKISGSIELSPSLDQQDTHECDKSPGVLIYVSRVSARSRRRHITILTSYGCDCVHRSFTLLTITKINTCHWTAGDMLIVQYRTCFLSSCLNETKLFVPEGLVAVLYAVTLRFAVVHNIISSRVTVEQNDKSCFSN